MSSADNAQDSDSDEVSTSSSSHGAGGFFHFTFNVRRHGRGVLKARLLNALAHGCVTVNSPVTREEVCRDTGYRECRGVMGERRAGTQPGQPEGQSQRAA